MQKIQSYLYPNRIIVTADLAGFTTEYKNVYQRNVKIYNGVDNVIEFDIKNADQKRIDLATLKGLKLNVMDSQGNALSKSPYTLTPTTLTGIAKTVIPVDDLLDLSAQYLKYRITPKGYLIKKIKYPLIVSVILCTLIFIFYPFDYKKQGVGFLVAIYIAFFYALYAAIANAMYISLVLKNKFKNAGGSIAHIGFSLMIAGMLISGSNKKVISDSKVNGINVPMGKDPMSKKTEDPTENLTLIRQLPTRMGDYDVTYSKDSSGPEGSA